MGCVSVNLKEPSNVKYRYQLKHSIFKWAVPFSAVLFLLQYNMIWVVCQKYTTDDNTVSINITNAWSETGVGCHIVNVITKILVFP